MAWTDAVLKKLKKYYEKGMPTSEIGEKLGFSKNAVIGKINRLGWNTTEKKAKKPVKQTPKIEKKVKLSPKDLAIKQALALANLKSDQCRWPIGEPGTEGFHFCGKKLDIPGKPYCFEHCTVAYSLTKPKDLKKKA